MPLGLISEFGLHAHLVHRLDDALGDGVVAAAGAQRGLAAFVVHDGEADAVGFRSGCGCSGLDGSGGHLLAFHAGQFVGDGPRVERQSGDVGDAAQARGQLGLEVELEQGEHLRVAVLLDEVNAVVLLDELVHFAGEGICPEPQVVGLDGVFVAQLVAALGDAPVRSAVADDADLSRSCPS